MTLARKLGAGFGILLLMMAGIAGLTIVTVTGVKDQARLAKEESALFAGIAREMKFDAIQVQQWLTDISATRGLDGLDDGFQKADEARKSFLTGLSRVRDMYRRESNGKKVQALDELERKMQAYHEAGKVMAQAYIDGGPAAGNRHMAAFDTSAEDLAGDLDPFVEEQVAELNSAMESIAVSTSKFLKVTLGGTLLAMTVGIVASWLVARSITVPLKRVVALLQDLAQGEGDLTKRLDARSRDEVGELSRWFNTFMDKLHDIISQAKGAASHVATASRELLAATEQMAGGAQEQASSLEETAASLEEITGTVKQSADNARQANRLAVGSRDTAEKGGQVVTSAVGAMTEINQASARIAAIITTIDEIAFQTNLLALNAAVEAARAGEQGRGFAVVASEVRNLAQRSATAAKEIKGLIQDSMQKVEAGSELVGKSGETLAEIVGSVKRVTDIIAELAAASQEQSTGIDQVNRAGTQMDQVTQSNAAQTEEMSSTAQSLAAQAEELQALVGRFKLDDGIRAAKELAVTRAPVARPAGHERRRRDGKWQGVRKTDRPVLAAVPGGNGKGQHEDDGYEEV